MNGIETLIKKLSDDSQAERSEKLAQAQIKAQSIKDDFRARGQAEAESILAQAAQKEQADILRGAGNDALDASKLMLTAKHEVIDGAFKRANELLLSLPVDEYIAMLKNYVLAASESGKESIVLNKRDGDRVGKRLLDEVNAALKSAGKTAGLTLSDKSADIDGGFMLRSGSVETDCSISSLIEQQRYELSDTVAKILFQA